MTERGPVAYYLVSAARNLAAGLRLAFFLPLKAQHFRASAVHYAVLLAFNFSVWVFAAWVRSGFEGEFDPGAVAVYLAGAALSLFAALLIGQAYRAPERLSLFAVALSSADALFELVSLGLCALDEPALASAALLAWTWVAAVRSVAVCGGWQRPQLYQGAFAVSALMAAAFYFLPHTDVWVLPDDDQAAGEEITDEKLFHLQGELIDEALASIRRGKPGVPELYFVGFAPDASQDVFLHEVRYVKRLFDERLGTAGRSVVLASSHTALDELPIASVTNLERTLAAVGDAMNPDEDVLFLYITAHGNAQYRLSVSQPPLDLASLTPAALARILHEIPVKYRVVVVSSCYAGGFIEPLRDENTMVIAAAAPDRTSFGCQTGRDFTYFGEAYFRQALARTRSFTAAFDAAKAIVTRREQAEKLTPSSPQMGVGAAIAERLKHFPQ